ncbi:MAG: hypothetical protein OXC10_14575 [Rhodospirillaceae bacterium]|nr:hypothetical protein [Rhodospirillaceae bacterium]
MTNPDTDRAERLIAKAWRAMPDDLEGVDKAAWFAGIALAKAGADIQTACTAFASLTARQAGRPVWVTMENPDGTRTSIWDARLHGLPAEAKGAEVAPPGEAVH